MSKLFEAINEQINKEYYSAFLYLSMSTWLSSQGWVGAGNWMRIQYQEEIVHAEGLIRWLQRKEAKVSYKTIEAPRLEWNSMLDVFEQALEHEKSITASINTLAELATAEKDLATRHFLDWYIMEQVEEEENGHKNILSIKRCQNDLIALSDLDAAFGARSLNLPAIPFLA